MRFHPHLQEATFVTRLNRFAALMRRDGREVMVHVANSGRLNELLRTENPMLVAPAPDGTNRKTAYDLALVEGGARFHGRPRSEHSTTGSHRGRADSRVRRLRGS